MNTTLCENTRDRLRDTISEYRQEHGSVPSAVAILGMRLNHEEHAVASIIDAHAAIERVDARRERQSELLTVLDDAVFEATRTQARGGRSRW